MFSRFSKTVPVHVSIFIPLAIGLNAKLTILSFTNGTHDGRQGMLGDALQRFPAHIFRVHRNYYLSRRVQISPLLGT